MKAGLSSFLLDVDNSTALKLIEAEYGIKGFGVVVKLWQKIYKECGYYTEFTNDVTLLFADENKLSVSLVSQIAEQACKRGIFDKGLYDKYSVLTSESIQEKFLCGVKRWKRVKLIREYLLLELGQLPANAHIVSRNGGANVSISEENVCSFSTNTKSKSKNKSKGNGNGNMSPAAAPAAADDVDKKDNADECIKAYEKYIGAATPSVAGCNDNAEADECIKAYEKYIGTATPSVAEGIDYFLSEGMEAELVKRIVEYSAEQNARRWSYVNKVLLGNLSEGVKTLDAYNKAKADRLDNAFKAGNAGGTGTGNRSGAGNAPPKQSRFANFTDNQTANYDAAALQAFEDML